MNQLGIPAEMRQAPALAQADIERVVVHKISKVWEFHFVVSDILPIEIFLELKKGLSEEISKTGNKAVFEIKARSQEFSNHLLQSYYREAFSEGPCASQGFKSLYQNLQVRADVPLAEMFGYATVLRSASQGRGTFMMVFDHYEDVPKSVQEEILKKNKGED